MRPVVVAVFDSPHEAHLARGRLEAEGILVSISGEHLTDLAAASAGTGGAVKLQVPDAQAETAREILSQDYSAEVDRVAGREPRDEPVICPACGSASVQDLKARKPPVWSRLLGAASGLTGRRFECLTCGQRWR